MRNYIRNGDFRILHAAGSTADLGIIAVGCTTTADSGNRIVEIAGINSVTPIQHGICPGWGHGCGGGAISRVKFLTRAAGEQRVPSMPQRWLWIGWDQPLDPEHGADGSGWAPTYPFRYTFLETMFHRAFELLGQYVAFSFYAAVGVGQTMPVLPVFWTNYADGAFQLHDLRIGFNVDGELRRCYGIAKIPHAPAGQEVDPEKFYIGFGLDSTTPTPCPILLGDFKVWRVPDLYEQVEARHINEDHMLLTNWYGE